MTRSRPQYSATHAFPSPEHVKHFPEGKEVRHVDYGPDIIG